MVQPEPVPAPIADLAQTCVRFVHEALGLDLDFAPETLPILDHYVRQKAGNPTDEIRDLLTAPLGAYFGEVIRRTMEGARWHAPGEAYENYRIEFDPFFLHFNPLGIAAEVLAGEDVEGLSAHFQILDEARGTLEEALARSESVSVDDYYSFTIRFETLELVVSVLSGLEAQQQERPRRFGPEVYSAAVGEASGKGGVS
jgi:hypothetical protein